MITKPLPFEDAIAFLLDKEQLPAEWDAKMWHEQEPDFRTRAFWMANQENARFVDRSQGLLFDYLAKTRDRVTNPSGETSTALRVADRTHFVELMRDFMIAEGMAKPEEFKDVNQKDVTDIRSRARLNLIFDTNVRQAYGYGHWKQGMTPAVLAAFPAARLIRDTSVKEPRLRHQANLGEVRLKTDPRWAKFHNDPLIGGFGVPWGPYGFNSGVTQEDVSRAGAERAGLRVPDASELDAANLNDGLQASVRKMDPALKAKLLAELRGGPKPRDPREAAREAAADVRREMLARGLTDAVTRGQTDKAEQYRAAIANLPQIIGLIVREEGEKIVLEKSASSGMVSVDETMRGIPIHTGGSEGNTPSVEAGIAQSVRTASKDVYDGWTIPGSDESQGDVSHRAIEAQIAAASTGRKPLYCDPWGSAFSDAFAKSYRKVLPLDVKVISRDGMLMIYKEESVIPILDSDPAFYRVAEESVEDSIARVSISGMNGELLGYGARSILSRPAYRVEIYKGTELELYFFVSSPDRELAITCANERMKDFVLAHGWTDLRFVIEYME